MSKKPKAPKLVDADSYGEALHVALRKACDSHQTTIAYHAIAEMSATGWTHYVLHVTPTIKTFKDPATAGTLLNVASLKWKYRDVPRMDNSHAVILMNAFRLFTDNDWEGFASFLFYV